MKKGLKDFLPGVFDWSFTAIIWKFVRWEEVVNIQQSVNKF